MAKSQSMIGFRLMCFVFKIRDFLFPRIHVLEEVGIQPGSVVLDYGCGCGSYILPLACIIGSAGEIYALDIQRSAVQAVETLVAKNSLKNVKTIFSDCRTGLPDQSVDTVLLYDIFHHLDNADEILRELSRILKPEGRLSFSDHHMKAEVIEEKFTGHPLFTIKKKDKKTVTLSKIVMPV